MLYIYTENFFILSWAKSFVKMLLGRQNRGPQAVEASLLRGLNELGVSYVLDKQLNQPIDIACVISGSQTLRWVLAQKKRGFIKKIIAGPNIVVFPQDADGVLVDPMVDIVVAPSEWVKQLYASLAPSLENKIRVWPAGVELPALEASKKGIDFLVYNKTGNSGLCNNIVKHLEHSGFKFKVFNYGHFRQPAYFENVERSKFMIYLSASESQGLAMFEAWARNVPTLVWEKGRYEGGGKIIVGKISAPYLTDRAGLAFSSTEDFSRQLERFVKTDFNPRKYVEENFTNKIVAQIFLEILK